MEGAVHAIILIVQLWTDDGQMHVLRTEIATVDECYEMSLDIQKKVREHRGLKVATILAGCHVTISETPA